ncbi:hypothetical protein [Treponema sp.]|uniref:hypothetical protein n=1 Tax=Treponema sp. TaxID=166 RepID=UPI00389022FA
MSVKKVFCLISALFLTEQAVFCFGGRAPQVAVGFINYYGNAPVEFAGFETVDGYVYTLQVEEGSKFTLKDIEAEQGNMLELTGQIDNSQKNGFQILKDGVFIVSDWKKL